MPHPRHTDCHHVNRRTDSLLSAILSLSLSSGAFYPLQIGDNVIVGEDTIINASSVGSYVHVGRNCVIVSSVVTLQIVKNFFQV